MSRIYILPSAKIRLGEIWEYTFTKWGESQADAYLHKLEVMMLCLEENRTRWKKLKDHRFENIYYLRCEHHYAFFKEMGDTIGIISVLHEKMDLMKRLEQDYSVL